MEFIIVQLILSLLSLVLIIRCLILNVDIKLKYLTKQQVMELPTMVAEVWGIQIAHPSLRTN